MRRTENERETEIEKREGERKRHEQSRRMKYIYFLTTTVISLFSILMSASLQKASHH